MKLSLYIPTMDDIDLKFGSYFVPLSMIDEPYRTQIEKSISVNEVDIPDFMKREFNNN